MKIFTVCLTLVAFVGAALAGDTARKGTTGAEQLLVPVGARSIATSGAFLSNTIGVESIYYNPAGLAGAGRTEVMFSYMNYIADINVSYFSAGFNVGDIGSFGLSFKTFNVGDVPVTTVDSPEGTGAEFAPSFFTAGLTYSKQVTDILRAGLTVKFINESILSANARGLALDFGVQYRFAGNLSLGVAIKNLGGNMKYEGLDLQQRTDIPGATPTTGGEGLFSPVVEAFQIPSYFEMSTGYEFKAGERNSLMIGTTYRNNNALEDEWMFGAEAKLSKYFFLRGGHDLYMQNRSDSQYNWTFGGGFEYALESFHVNVDYAYRAVESFNGNNIVAVKLTF
jgi:opacity protein-like surface antigen